MTTQEERRKILEMVAAGTITPEDAARLLGAMDEGAVPTQTGEGTSPTSSPPKWLKIRVTNTNSGRPEVQISVPTVLVKAAFKLGSKLNVVALGEHGIGAEEMKQIEEALFSGEIGKIVDVYDREGGEHVEIYLE